MQRFSFELAVTPSASGSLARAVFLHPMWGWSHNHGTLNKAVSVASSPSTDSGVLPPSQPPRAFGSGADSGACPPGEVPCRDPRATLVSSPLSLASPAETLVCCRFTTPSPWPSLAIARRVCRAHCDCYSLNAASVAHRRAEPMAHFASD
jgi:hypothetical protein